MDGKRVLEADADCGSQWGCQSVFWAKTLIGSGINRSLRAWNESLWGLPLFHSRRAACFFDRGSYD